MIALRGAPFNVAFHYIEKFGNPSIDATGPVTTAHLTFEYWLNGDSVDADVFIDPGADATVISWRWISKVAQTRPSSDTAPMLDGSLLREEFYVQFAPGQEPLRCARACIGWQEAPDSPLPRPIGLPKMPGHEDILLGRDFLTQNGLLLLIDGKDRSFSLLHPGDPDNRRSRVEILRVLGVRPREE